MPPQLRGYMFKPGDKIMRINGDWYKCKLGNIYTFEQYHELAWTIDGKSLTLKEIPGFKFEPRNFRLVSRARSSHLPDFL